MNQEEKVLAYLKSGKILNKTIAKEQLGINNLNTAVFRLRDEGIDIEKEMKLCEKTSKLMAHYYYGSQRY